MPNESSLAIFWTDTSRTLCPQPGSWDCISGDWDCRSTFILLPDRFCKRGKGWRGLVTDPPDGCDLAGLAALLIPHNHSAADWITTLRLHCHWLTIDHMLRPALPCPCLLGHFLKHSDCQCRLHWKRTSATALKEVTESASTGQLGQVPKMRKAVRYDVWERATYEPIIRLKNLLDDCGTCLCLRGQGKIVIESHWPNAAALYYLYLFATIKYSLRWISHLTDPLSDHAAGSNDQLSKLTISV